MGNIVNNPTPTGNQINITDYQELASRDEKSYFGMAEITLSNYDNDNEPEVLNGSMYDIDNSVFVESSDLSITGWSGISIDTDTYIKAVVSGSGNSSTTAFEFTDTVPTWSQTKGGWYDGIDRYFFYLYKDGSGNYTDKKKMVDQNNYWFPGGVTIEGQLAVDIIGETTPGNGVRIGDSSTGGQGLNINGKTIAGASVDNITIERLSVSNIKQFTTANTENEVYDALVGYIPAFAGGTVAVSGRYGVGNEIILGLKKFGSSTVQVQYSSSSTVITTQSYVDGSGSTIPAAFQIIIYGAFI